MNNMEKLSLSEKWEIDMKLYKQSASNKTGFPQCFNCVNFIKGNARNCKKFVEVKKPNYVFFAEKECPYFTSTEILITEISDELYNKIYGGVYGFIVGDTLGVPVEFSTREERKKDEVKELRAYGTYHQPFGAWSDDSSLMLCLIDAINAGFTIEKLKNNFIDFYLKGKFTPYGKLFDIGISTRNAIEKMINEIEPTKCGGASEMDNGNGSLMRALPIAYISSCLTDTELIKLVENVSAMTHAHPRSKLACLFYIKLASYLISGMERGRAYECTIKFINKNCSGEYIYEFENYTAVLNKKIISYKVDQIKSTGYVVDTLEAVLWLFFNTNSYKEAVLKAVNLGGDTDTIAALVGGIAGIYYGFEEIPDNWIQSLYKKHDIMHMLNDFYKKIKQEK